MRRFYPPARRIRLPLLIPLGSISRPPQLPCSARRSLDRHSAAHDWRARSSSVGERRALRKAGTYRARPPRSPHRAPLSAHALDVLASYAHGVSSAVAILKQQHLSLRGLRYPAAGANKAGERAESSALSLPSALSFLKMLAKDILRGLLPDLPHMLGELLVQTVVSALPGLVGKSEKDELLPISSAGGARASVGAAAGGGVGGATGAPSAGSVDGGDAAARSRTAALGAQSRDSRARGGAAADRVALIEGPLFISFGRFYPFVHFCLLYSFVADRSVERALR